MTNIVKLLLVDEIIAAGDFTEQEKLYLHRVAGLRVNEFDNTALKDFCIDLYSLIRVNRGLKPWAPEDLKEKATLLCIDLRNYYSYNFVEDIREAINRGSLGQYGEVYGEIKEDYDAFNKSRLFLWIGKYLFENKERAEALVKRTAAIAKLSPSPVAPVSMEESYKVSLDIFRRKGEVYDIGNVVCRWLWNSGRLRCGKRHWEELMTQADKKLKAEYTAQRDKEAALKRMDEARRINELIKGLTQENVKAEAARMLLKEYFSALPA